MDLAKLAAIPDATVARTAAVARGVDDSVAYLGSDAAMRSLEIDPYWPKWHSPWWHMLLLHELGEARRIPARTAAAMVAGIDRLLHIFPIEPAERAGVDLQRDVACHCALGTMYAVLAACGIDVARALPWVKPWFARYQMADGGLNCDDSAYLQAGECPSSMVATVPPLEAMLVDTSVERRRARVRRSRGALPHRSRARARLADDAQRRRAHDRRRVARARLSALLLLRHAARPRGARALERGDGEAAAGGSRRRRRRRARRALARRRGARRAARARRAHDLLADGRSLAEPTRAGDELSAARRRRASSASRRRRSRDSGRRRAATSYACRQSRDTGDARAASASAANRSSAPSAWSRPAWSRPASSRAGLRPAWPRRAWSAPASSPSPPRSASTRA